MGHRLVWGGCLRTAAAAVAYDGEEASWCDAEAESGEWRVAAAGRDEQVAAAAADAVAPTVEAEAWDADWRGGEDVDGGEAGCGRVGS